MFQAMTEDQSAALGGVYFLVFFGGVIWLLWWFNRRFGEGIRRSERKRQIETYVRRFDYDADILSEVMDDLDNEYARRHRR
ncbi:hypothetical protein ACFWN1_14995 [Streptomyces sp. NPDC058459]|uniref:hypothetical protein n=1 Tax=Streptomyces sp. NPDC058459 TaxID=3346508 RepID=UPI0036551569